MTYPWFLPRENPTFVATYERPEWALRLKLACGHPVASQDNWGRCGMCVLLAAMKPRRKAMRVKR